jgi:hypothetical protein
MKRFFGFLVALFGLCLTMPIPAAQHQSFLLSLLWVAVVISAIVGGRRLRKWDDPARCGGIDITETNGNVSGTIQTNDGIMGLICTAKTGDSYTLGTPILITSAASAITGGNALSMTHNAFALSQINNFYAQPGNTTAQLYFMGVADTMTVADMCDHSNSNGIIKLWNYANGAMKGFGALSDDTLVTVPGVTGVNTDCYTAVTNAQAFCVAAQAAFKPCFAVIGGTSYSGTVGDVTDETDGTSSNYAQLLIGDIEAPGGYSGGKGAAVGYYLGKIASCDVAVKVSDRTQGPLAGVNEAYVGSETIEVAGGDMITLANKGIITFCNVPNLVGYFFGNNVFGLPGDRMCTVASDDYNTLTARRVINKAFTLVYGKLASTVDGHVPTLITGVIEPKYAAWLQLQMDNLIDRNMTSAGEDSGVTAFVDPTQNIVTSGGVTVNVSLGEDGYASGINVKLGLQA